MELYIQPISGPKRKIGWAELNQLKKDILWIYSENTSQLNAVFVPAYSFQSSYWEYLTLSGDGFSEEDRAFYIPGVLIIILCMTIEYIDTSSGDPSALKKGGIEIIVQYVQGLETADEAELKLKRLVGLGLTVATSMTPQDLLNTEPYEHTDLEDFYRQLDWVDDVFIKSFFFQLSANNKG